MTAKIPNQMEVLSNTINVAQQKEYTLIAHTGNLIFIHNKYISNLYIPKKFIDNPINIFDYSILNKYKFKKILLLNFFII